MKSLLADEKRIKEYLEAISRLANWPGSQRVFNEVFDEGRGLLRDYGIGLTVFGVGRKILDYRSLEGELFGLSLGYGNRILSSCLTIGYRKFNDIGEFKNKVYSPEKIFLLKKVLKMPYRLDFSIDGVVTSHIYSPSRTS